MLQTTLPMHQIVCPVHAPLNSMVLPLTAATSDGRLMDLALYLPTEGQQFQPSAFLKQLETLFQCFLGDFPTFSRSEQQETEEQHEELPSPPNAQLGTLFIPSEDSLKRHSDGTSESTSEKERN